MSSDSELSDFSESSNDDENIDVVYSQYIWRTIGAKIQLLNFACTFGIRCCSFTICTYICNSTFKFAISLFQLTI